MNYSIDWDGPGERDRDDREAFRKTLRAIPGYPWLPCPICHHTASCEHIAAERAKAAGVTFGNDTAH